MNHSLSARQSSIERFRSRLPWFAAKAEIHRQRAVLMNEIAGQFESPDDARRLVDMVAVMFAEHVPRTLRNRGVRRRIALAEYEAATDRQKLIPDQRVADAWNGFARQIGAPDEALATAAEIHNLRDGFYAGGRILWARGNQHIWTIPNLYALGLDGKVANGCRVVEALRVIADLVRTLDNLRGARELLKKGVLLSDIYSSRPYGQCEVRCSVQARAADDPIQAAAARYASENGAPALNDAAVQLITNLLSA